MHPAATAFLRSMLLLLILSAAWLSSQPLFSAPSPLIQTPVLLSDPQGQLTAVAAARQATIDAGTAHHDVDLKTPVYWWVGEVVNPGPDDRWIVHLGNTAIERARLYVLADGQVIQEQTIDLLALKREETPTYTIGYHFPVQLPSGSRRTIALRLETEVAHKGLIFVKPEKLAQREAHFQMVAIWTAAGAIAALVCYNLFLGVNLRLAHYLFYVGHAGGHLLYLLTALGLVGAGFPVMQRYLLFNAPGIGIAVLCGTLFIYSFLELPSLAPRLARLYRWFAGALLLSPLLAFVAGPHFFLTAIRGSHLMLVVLVIAAAFIGVQRGKYEARYILVGWGGLVAMTAKGMLGVLGVVELTIDAGVWALWAVTFEMFLLSLALADRVRRLNREKEAAQAANEAKSAFLATMSHEIRTPLNGVLGMVDVLRGTRLDETQRRYLDNISQCGSGLLTVLNDVLDYSRLEARGVTLEKTTFSPRRLVEGVAFMLSPEAEKKGLQLRHTVEPDVPPILAGDPGRLQQVLLNLVGNAVKFTERGEVHLRLTRLSADGTGACRLRFSVTDTGIGIDADAIDGLFDRFHQADTSIARRYGGTGLGLSITRELVALMGGEIHVTSRLGQGSRFEVDITLPLGESPAAAATGDQTPSPRPLDVLVVDDDAINRLVAAQLLAREGHRVATVESGAAALESSARERFDVVLMDLGMPGMDGLEATRRLRADGVTCPIIGLTAHVLPEQQLACLASGMDAVLHKPIDGQRLNSVLANVVDASTPTPAIGGV